jgi:hypothetical protein
VEVFDSELTGPIEGEMWHGACSFWVGHRGHDPSSGSVYSRSGKKSRVTEPTVGIARIDLFFFRLTYMLMAFLPSSWPIGTSTNGAAVVLCPSLSHACLVSPMLCLSIDNTLLVGSSLKPRKHRLILETHTLTWLRSVI